MDFTFDDQQLAFRDAIHKFLMMEAAPEQLREIWDTKTGRAAESRAKLADQGLTAISVPEQYGGMNLGDLDWVLIQFEMGYYAVPDVLTDSAYIAVDILRQLPDHEPLRKDWLNRIANGHAQIAVGHPVNPFVSDAENADLLLLWHNDEVHAVDPKAVKLSRNKSIDRSRRLYRVEWTPTTKTRLCEAEIGRTLWQAALNRAGVALAAQLLGLAQRMLDLGVDYTATRKQFGKPVGSFQAVKHHLADVAVKIEFAKPVIYRAAYAVAQSATGADVAVSHARIVAGEAALLSARKSIQVHGAMGYTLEVDLQWFMKRAWALNAAWGDLAFHKSRVATSVLGEATIGPGSTFN